MTATAFSTDTALYDALPMAALPDPVIPKDPSLPAQVTSNIGVIAMAVASTIVIIALITAVGSARTATTKARTATAIARGETAKAQAATQAAEAKAQAAEARAAAEHAAGVAAANDLNDLRAVAVRANNCIESLFPIMNLLLDSSYIAASRAITNSTPICRGLGPLLKGTGSV